VNTSLSGIPVSALRRSPAGLPQVSELQVVRHYTNLSRRNFSIDTQFYPLGSCTMKYNPRGAHAAAMLPGFLARHPLAPESVSQGFLACLYDLQEILRDVTGMRGVSLTPMAGAQGEFAGRGHDPRLSRRSRRSWAHRDPGAQRRPRDQSGHRNHVRLQGRRSARGRQRRRRPRGPEGGRGPQTAGLMMTNPSTCGVFERRVEAIARVVHDAGGLLYYDGANLNAILGQVKPGDMGFDVLHMNLHKTFATPHGGGGPGAGPVGVGERLLPFLPTPIVGQEAGRYRWLTDRDLPQSIGRLSAFAGNAGILLRALAYALMLGRDGMTRVGEYATLNANYLARKLEQAGFELAYPERRATHEFILTFAALAKSHEVTAMDVAKRLLDYGVHSPTTYFPLLVPECFLIEPTETETKAELDAFIDALVAIRREAETDPDLVRGAPHSLPVRRLDDVKAARESSIWPGPIPPRRPDGSSQRRAQPVQGVDGRRAVGALAAIGHHAVAQFRTHQSGQMGGDHVGAVVRHAEDGTVGMVAVSSDVQPRPELVGGPAQQNLLAGGLGGRRGGEKAAERVRLRVDAG
jgi:glycine dehydrogenase subunit 2